MNYADPGRIARIPDRPETPEARKPVKVRKTDHGETGGTEESPIRRSTLWGKAIGNWQQAIGSGCGFIRKAAKTDQNSPVSQCPHSGKTLNFAKPFPAGFRENWPLRREKTIHEFHELATIAPFDPGAPGLRTCANSGCCRRQHIQFSKSRACG